MRVIVEKPYGIFSVGHVIPNMPANQARTMIARGMVAEDTGKASETKALRSPLDRMMRSGATVTKQPKRHSGALI